MKRLPIIPTVFALVVMVAACTEDTTAPDVTPQFARASTPNCLEVLATFFAPIDGLRSEIEGTRAVAEASGIPLGTVLSRLTRRTGDVNTCLGCLFGGG
jgi:hypothetical protein